MRYRLAAVDMDGTLLNGDKQVTPKTREALLSALKQGTIVTLCTGRPLQGLTDCLDLITPDAPVVTYNGGAVLTSRTGRLLYGKTLEPAAALEIIRRGLERGAIIIAWADDKLYVSELSEPTEKYARLSGSERLLLEEPMRSSLAEAGIIKIIWMDWPERIAGHLKYAQEKPVGDARAVLSSPYLLEFMDKAASKAEGLRLVAAYYGLDRKEIMAVGDNYNDIDMLEYAGLGVAMGNAPDEVKAAADFVTLSNEEDGVAAAFEKFILT